MRNHVVPPESKVYTDALKKIIRMGAQGTTDLAESVLLQLASAREDDLSPMFVWTVNELIDALYSITDPEPSLSDRDIVLDGLNRKMAEILLGLRDFSGVSASERHAEVTKLYYYEANGKDLTREADRSDSAAKRWARFSKEPLDRLLMTILQALTRKFQQRLNGSAPGPSRHDADPGGDIPNEPTYRTKLWVVYNMPLAPGMAQRTLERRAIMALGSPLKSWHSNFTWTRKGTAETSIQLFGAGTIMVDAPYGKTLSNNKQRASRTVEVVFDAPLAPDQSAEFSILKAHPVDFDHMTRPDHQRRSFVAPAIPIDHYEVLVRFPPNKPPSEVWYFEDMPSWLAPGVATTQSRLDMVAGCAQHVWDRPLRIGYSYGIAWRYDADEPPPGRESGSA